LILCFPEIGLELLRIIAIRNRRLIQHYKDLSYRTVESRIAKLFLDLSQKGSQTIKRKDHSIEEMASLIASVGPVISRTLNGLKQMGLITATRNTIILERPDEIARIAGMDLNLID
jgi:CRP-like cAMP-binding protein